MPDGEATELCRVSVMVQDRRVDVALPALIPLAELVPVLLRNLVGETRTAPGPGDAAGWCLQRAGEAPVDLANSVQSAGIRHGDVLYLRPRAQAAPPLAIDDVVAAIGEAATTLPGRWSRPVAQRWTLVVLGVFLAAGTMAAVWSGPPWPSVAGLGTVLCLVALAAAAVASRALGRPEVAFVLALGATGYAFVAGVALGASGLARGGAGVLLVGCAAVLPAAALATTAVPTEAPAFLGVAVAAGSGVAASLAAVAGLGTNAAAVAVGAAVLLAPALPASSYRLSGLPLPVVPTSRPELAQARPLVSSATVERGTDRADRMVTGALGGLSLVAAVSGAVLAASAPTPVSMALLGAAAAALGLRGRHYPAVAQRLWTYAGATTVTLELAYAIYLHSGPPARTAVLLGLVAVAAALALAGPWGAGQVRSPVPGRLADLLEVVVVVATLPLALAVLGAYRVVLGLGG